MVEGGAPIEAVGGRIAQPLDESVDDAVHAEGGVPFAIDVEVDAEDPADQNVGVADEPIVSDDDRRRMVWVRVAEPQLHVLVAGVDRESGRVAFYAARGDTQSGMKVALADVKVLDLKDDGVPGSEVEEV